MNRAICSTTCRPTPAKQQPLADAAVEARMVEHMVRFMQENEAPPEQYERLGLVAELVAG